MSFPRTYLIGSGMGEERGMGRSMDVVEITMENGNGAVDGFVSQAENVEDSVIRRGLDCMSCRLISTATSAVAGTYFLYSASMPTYANKTPNPPGSRIFLATIGTGNDFYLHQTPTSR